MTNIRNLLTKVQESKPLVHHITNYVTVTDCANITLGIGASPVMADSVYEVADIAGIASAVVINIGTLNERTVESMLVAGKAANARGIPVVFDPVGAGASKYRNETTAKLLKEIKIDVLRGNISEIRFIAGLSSETKGVDAADNDRTDIENAGQIAKNLSQKLGCVVSISGAIDIISNGDKIAYVDNGHTMLGNLTGTGCMCSSLVGSFCGANKDNVYESAIITQLCMGIAGEIAYEKAGSLGNGSFHEALHDSISLMNSETIEKRAKYREE